MYSQWAFEFANKLAGTGGRLRCSCSFNLWLGEETENRMIPNTTKRNRLKFRRHSDMSLDGQTRKLVLEDLPKHKLEKHRSTHP